MRLPKRAATVRRRVGVDVSDRRRYAATSRVEGRRRTQVSSVDVLPINRDSISGRAILERRTIQVPDMLRRGGRVPAEPRDRATLLNIAR